MTIQHAMTNSSYSTIKRGRSLQTDTEQLFGLPARQVANSSNCLFNNYVNEALKKLKPNCLTANTPFPSFTSPFPQLLSCNINSKIIRDQTYFFLCTTYYWHVHARSLNFIGCHHAQANHYANLHGGLKVSTEKTLEEGQNKAQFGSNQQNISTKKPTKNTSWRAVPSKNECIYWTSEEGKHSGAIQNLAEIQCCWNSRQATHPKPSARLFISAEEANFIKLRNLQKSRKFQTLIMR